MSRFKKNFKKIVYGYMEVEADNKEHAEQQFDNANYDEFDNKSDYEFDGDWEEQTLY